MMRKLVPSLALLLFATHAYAQVPQQFTVQGVLRDGSGALQSQMVNVTVSFFDAQSNGNQIAGPYGPTTVMAADGLFTLTISDPAIVSRVQGKPELWLQVTVGNDTFARQIVTPEIYALMCSSADDTARIKGTPVATTAPIDGQALVFGGGQYAPAPVYPVFAKTTVASIEFPPNTTKTDSNLSVALTPPSGKGIFLVLLSGNAGENKNGTFSLQIADTTSGQASGMLGDNGGGRGNIFTMNGATTTGSALYGSCSLSWVEAVNDLVPTKHTFVVQTSVSAGTGGPVFAGDLTALWFPQP